MQVYFKNILWQPYSAETILIIEDDEAVRKVTQRMLKGLGYHVLTASSGIEAVEMVRHEGDKINLALLDMEMPGVNGSKTYQLLTLAQPGLKVIVYSGHEVNGPSRLCWTLWSKLLSTSLLT